jgi:nucleoid DNA-binding protein
MNEGIAPKQRQNHMAIKPKPLKTPAVKLTVSKNPTPTPKNPPKPVAVQDTTTPMIDALKKKDLIDKVVATTGAKKALVRDIVEATLTVLGDALSKGAMLNLPPFGKAKVSRASDAASGRPMTVKLRRSPASGQRDNKAAKQALADAED